MERKSGVSSELASWIDSQRALISSVFFDFYNSPEVVRMRKKTSFLLDPQKRLLSEMPLCQCLSRIESPDSYVLNKNTVEFGDDGCKMRYLHLYFVNGGYVVCLTAGQFVKYSENLERGERLVFIQSQMPDNVCKITTEIFLLAATKHEIFEKLDIKFS